MSRKKSVDQVAEIIETEGLGYAIQHYLSPENIADKKLADMWQRAAALLKEIERYVETA